MKTSSSYPSNTANHSRALGLMLIVEGLLSFAPVIILGAAIGWPASLGKPAGEQLSAIAANANAVTLGYGVYLLYSVLIAPVMVMLAGRVFGGFLRPVAICVAVFAALSTLARCIGILRWLTVMPELAATHAKADPAGRATVELVFNAVHTYGGGIGEILGVGLFMALSVGTLSVAAWREGSMPKWLAALGMVSTALMASMLFESLRIAIDVPVAVVVTVLTVWMFGAGVWAWVSAKRAPR
jgi:Domain of unknown function (DUF4386)